MLTKVAIKNFKSLRDVQIDLERFTVFVGPNASGKSSILQAINWLCRLFRVEDSSSLDENLLPQLSRGSKEPMELTGDFANMSYRYRTRTGPKQRVPRPQQWSGEGRGVASTSTNREWNLWQYKATESKLLPNTILLRLEASKLTQPNPANDHRVMNPDGSGMHSALASMALSKPEAWSALQQDVIKIISTVRRLRFTDTNPPALLFDAHGADSLLATQVSEGTLLVLGLLTALHATGRQTLVLLDDLDRGLHPKAQRDLIALLRDLLNANPGLQLFATTHSPYMLDCMDPKEVRMTFLRDDGTTVCSALAQHPQFDKWKDEMTPGEMWSLFGEKWIVEGVPA